MTAWTCPECQRSFGHRNQSHECAPALSLTAYFETAKPFERPIFDVVAAHLADLEPLTVEFVAVGIFFKRLTTFAELRPMRDRVRLSMLLSRLPPRDRRIARTWSGRSRHAIWVDLRTPADFDEVVRDWLLESYFSSREG